MSVERASIFEERRVMEEHGLECWREEGRWCVVYVYWGKRESGKYSGSMVENVETGYTFEERERAHIRDGRARAKAREKKGEGKMSFDEEKFDDFFSRDPSGFTCGKIVFYALPLFN